MANLILQNENHVSQTFQDVTEVEIPTAEGGTQTFSIGGGSTVEVTRLFSYTTSKRFTESDPSKVSDLNSLGCVVTKNIAAGKTIQDVSFICGLNGYGMINGDVDTTFTVSDRWNDSAFGSVTQTVNQDGTTTVTVTFAPQNWSIYRTVFAKGYTAGEAKGLLYVIITTTE